MVAVSSQNLRIYQIPFRYWHWILKKLQDSTTTCLTNLTQAAPYFGLNRGVHLLLVDCHGYELVQDGCDTLALCVVIVLAEPNQVEQPWCHVLQAEMLQLNTCGQQTTLVDTMFIGVKFTKLLLMAVCQCLNTSSLPWNGKCIAWLGYEWGRWGNYSANFFGGLW